MICYVIIYFQMLIVLDIVDENFDIVQIFVMVYVYVCDEFGGDV